MPDPQSWGGDHDPAGRDPAGRDPSGLPSASAARGSNRSGDHGLHSRPRGSCPAGGGGGAAALQPVGGRDGAASLHLESA
jgi:hypothetical protein